MKSKLQFLFVALLCTFLQAFPQVFEEVTSANLPGLSQGNLEWGDFDQDGDLDVLCMGYSSSSSPLTAVYRNSGDNTFSVFTGASLTDLYSGDCAWGDYNNDGFLDILITGMDAGGTPFTRIYRNNSGGSFSLQSGISLRGLEYSSADWGDYDYDGDIDILLTGVNSGNIAESLVYRNNGNNTFTQQTGISLTGVSRGSCDWVDVDDDGLLDIFLTGYDQNSTSICALYLNEGDGSFTERTGLPFTGVYYSSASWGDYDNDGDLDLLLTGYSTQLTTSLTIVYKQGYNFSFSDQGISVLKGVYIGSGEWGDYDSDGDLDIMLSGYCINEGKGITELFRNDGDNSFAEYTGNSFPELYYSGLQWGDFDGDRDLDILVNGYAGSGITRLYRNNSSVQNTPPPVPSGLDFFMNGDGMHFKWNQTVDPETNRYSSGYNLRIGTSPGACDIMSGSSDFSTGKLFLVEPGNAGRDGQYILASLPAGTYYWSVQAVDHGYLASAFSEEQVFENLFSLGYVFEGSGVPKLGDYDGDMDLDILIANSTVTTVFRNDIGTGGSFTDINAGMPRTYGGDTDYAWGDYDNDGDLDIAYCGYWGGFWTRIYRNDNGIFTDIEAVMEGAWMGALSWIDYNNDGDLDLLIYGNHEQSDDGEPLGKLYRNDGNDVFTDTELDVEEARRGDVTVGDYNKDGYPDILTNGFNLSENMFTSVLRNNAGISFSNIHAGIKPGSLGSMAWGDYDNDSDLDFYFVGEGYEDGPVRIYQNQGDDSFIEIQTGLPGGRTSYVSTSQWGDFDHDGDLDLLPDYGSSIIRNDGNNVFSLMETNIRFGGCMWGDMDNDGDLDIVTGGAVYLNSQPHSNNPPADPENLETAIAGNQATLSWNPGTDDHTPSGGLTYNVRIGTNPGAGDILSPMVENTNGYNRALPSMGNAMTNTFKIIRDLPLGTYYWSVQAVDQSYKSSPFAAEGSFEIFPMFSNLEDELFDRNDRAYLDYDNDGQTEILSYENGGLALYKFEGLDDLTLIASNIPGDNWFDFDGDGDLDRVSSDAIFRNDLNGTFVNMGITHSIPMSGTPGDFDADGDIDFLSGATIFRNEGDLTFSEMDLNLGSGYYLAYYWFDFDNDSDLDILLAHGSYLDFQTDIFRNDGDTTFINIHAGLIGVWEDYGLFSFADYNSDGFMDIYVGGEDNDYNKQSIIYRNNGDESFTRMDANIRGYRNQKVFWGDYNYDGSMDLVISGDNNGRIRNKLYQNNNDGTFMELGVDNIIESMAISTSGDYDQDGDLDKITSAGVFRNNTNQGYSSPGELSGLTSDLKGLDCLLTWDRSDDSFGKGYSYNVRIGTTPGGYEIKGPNLISGFGNVPCDSTWLIRNLEPGNYYWSVQAVNQVYARGPWAPEQSFLITDVSPDFDFDTVCHGFPTTFTDLSVTTDVIVRWHWNFDDGSTSEEEDPVHLFPSADTFNVSLWVYSQSGDSTERIHPVIVLASPDAAFMVDPVCKDEPSILTDMSVTTGVDIASWEWDFGNGESSNVQGTVEKTYVNSATAVLTITGSNGCWDADTQGVVIAPYPLATLGLFPEGGYSNVFCEGDSTLLVVPKQAGYNYQWKLNNANIFGATDTFLYVKSPSGEYLVEVENPLASCVSKDSMEITVNPSPSSPVISSSTDPAALCEGEALRLYIPDIAGTTFDWRRGGGSLGTNSHEIFPVESGAYTVFITNSDNCTAASESAITVNFLDLPVPPSISVQGNTNFCSGDSATLNVTETMGLHYQWIRDNQVLTGETLTSLVARQEGAYEIEVWDDNACTIKGTEAVNIFVRTRPGAPSISVEGSTSTCDGDTVKLSVPYDPDYTYEWTRDGGLTGGSNGEYYPLEDGSYSVTITNSVNCSVDALDAVVIDILDNPDQPTIIAGNTDICEGEGVLMRVTDVPGLIYAWYRDNQLQQEGTQYSYTATESGSYTVEVSNADNCSSRGTESVDISVRNIPVVPAISVEGNTTLCEGEVVKLSVPHTPGYEYVWKRDGGGTSIDTTLIYPAESGSYNVTITNNGFCPVEPESPVAILFRARPAVPPISYPGDTMLCEGESIILRTSDVAGLTYQWYDSDELLFGEESSSLTVTENGNYRVIVSNEILCQTESDKTVTIKVNPLPPTSLIEVSGDAEFCGTDSVKLSVPWWNGYSYRWTRDEGLLPDMLNEIYVSLSGNYKVTLVNEHECERLASNSVDVRALAYPSKPVIQGTNETSFCTGEVLQFTFDNLGANEACIWSRDMVVVADSVEQINVTESGEYFLEIINDIGCKSPPSGMKSISFYDSPTTPILSIGTDTIMEICPDVLSDISVTNYNAAYTYYWYHNTLGITPDDNAALAGNLEEGTYQLKADIEGCESPMVRFNLVWKEAPEKPTIVVDGGPVVYYIFCENQEADSYQWYYNGDAISGANEYFYVANRNLGTYQLEIAETDKECSIRSDLVHVPDLSTGLDTYEAGSMRVYPNPSSGEFILELKDTYFGKAWLKIVSASGKTLIHKELKKDSELLEERISIKLLPGFYLLQLETGDSIYMERIIIE